MSADKISVAKQQPRLSRAFQEALYAYTLAKLPTRKSTKAKEKSFREGIEEFERGEFITLEEWDKTKSKKSSR